MATVCSSRLAPHICPDTVRHWFGTVKTFPAVNQLLRVLFPGSPVCVARGRDLTNELAYSNYLSSLYHDGAIQDKVCADVTCGRALVFNLGSAADIRGLRDSPLAVVLNPKFRIVHDLTFARVGGRTSVKKRPKRFFRAALRARQRAPRCAAAGSILVSETR